MLDFWAIFFGPAHVIFVCYQSVVDFGHKWNVFLSNNKIKLKSVLPVTSFFGPQSALDDFL